jgi:hypothetical protein
MPATDFLFDKQLSVTAPAYLLANITPSDSVTLPYTGRGIHVTGSSGNVAITTAGMPAGTSVQLYIAQGGLFPALVTQIWATGTTATGIVAAY